MAEDGLRSGEQVAQQLRGGRFSLVTWVTETGSTNADLLDDGRQDAPEQARITDHQTAGRGRRDRQWFAPPDSALMMSVLVRRGIKPEGFFRVTMAMGLAATDAVKTVCGVEAVLKWPNDVLVGDKKLAGILAESALGARPFVVVGMGMNVSRQALEALPPEVAAVATCLAEHAPIAPNTRVELAAAVLRSLEYWLGADDAGLVATYRQRLDTIGRTIIVTRDDRGPLHGVATGVTGHGELIVRADGADHTLTVGDVSHVRPVADQTRPQ